MTGTSVSGHGVVPLSDIGAGTPSLSAYYFLAAVETTFGVTYFDISGRQIGPSTTLTIPAAAGATAAVQLPNIPPAAVGADLTHEGGSSVDVYLFTPATSGGATEADFLTYYARYRRKAIQPKGTRVGR